MWPDVVGRLTQQQRISQTSPSPKVSDNAAMSDSGEDPQDRLARSEAPRSSDPAAAVLAAIQKNMERWAKSNPTYLAQLDRNQRLFAKWARQDPDTLARFERNQQLLNTWVKQNAASVARTQDLLERFVQRNTDAFAQAERASAALDDWARRNATLLNAIARVAAAHQAVQVATPTVTLPWIAGAARESLRVTGLEIDAGAEIDVRQPTQADDELWDAIEAVAPDITDAIAASVDQIPVEDEAGRASATRRRLRTGVLITLWPIVVAAYVAGVVLPGPWAIVVAVLSASGVTAPSLRDLLVPPDSE